MRFHLVRFLVCRSSWAARPRVVDGNAWALVLGLAAAACGASSSQGAQTPADRAAFMERTRCAEDVDEKAIAPIVGGGAVVGVQPLYSSVPTGKSGLQAELRGATIGVSALPGMTPEWLDRALECHGARATLGHIPAAPADPFWIPDGVVDIDVRPAKDGFEVAVTGYSPEAARRILDRANAFATAKTVAQPKL